MKLNPCRDTQFYEGVHKNKQTNILHEITECLRIKMTPLCMRHNCADGSSIQFNLIMLISSENDQISNFLPNGKPIENNRSHAF